MAERKTLAGVIQLFQLTIKVARLPRGIVDKVVLVVSGQGFLFFTLQSL